MSTPLILTKKQLAYWLKRLPLSDQRKKMLSSIK